MSDDGHTHLRLVGHPVKATPDRTGSRIFHPSQPRGRGPALYVSGNADEELLPPCIARLKVPVTFVLARGGRAGLHLAAKRRPRLVVVEAKLSDLDVESFVTALRRWAMPPGAPIVVMAHESTTTERARFIWAGASLYVSDPHDGALVERAVGVALEVSAWR